ncbi:MAG: LON peptidase substrate-binding domain-containing protein, partial [Bacteroidales bacterium]|nr:LON peptidase substrate-binding domain-containing protein [Bacteroidales bacterium]
MSRKKHQKNDWQDLILFDEDTEKAEFIPLVTDEQEESMNKVEVPDTVPILPLRNTVLFPGVILPITVG